MHLGIVALLALFGTGAVSGAYGAEVEGVKIEDRIYIAQGVPELVLNGAGVRRKLLFAKVYVTALYLTQKQATSDAVLADTGPKRIAMHILQEEVTADQLVAALHDGLAANNQPPDLAPLERRIRDLAGMMHQIGKINHGGTVLLDYLPDIGTRVTVNGVSRLTIPGHDFNRAMLRIWLGDKPVDGRLKQVLLGGKDNLLPF